MKIHADHTTLKHLGNWTSEAQFEVRARHSFVVLDLRSPQIQGDVTIMVDAERSTLKLLLPEDVAVEQWDLRWEGRGKVKDWAAPAEPTATSSDRRDPAADRVVRLVGTISHGEVRIHRAGMAVLSAMFSRAFVDDVIKSRRSRSTPTVADPANTPA